MFLLDNRIQPYAWGSRTAIFEILGIPPTGEPAAELWMGDHPQAPSAAAGGDSLDKIIAADPVGTLGAPVVDRFGARLPFLLKILAADKPLSIQVHPHLVQAKAGFAAEDEAGVPRDAPNRSYRDPNHKPELLCALTPFEALCGFRSPTDTVRLFDALGVAELAPYRALLLGEDGLRAAFTALVSLPLPERAPLVQAVAAACARVAAAGGEWAGPAGAVVFAVQEFPGDIGPVVSLLLNHLVLSPGEALFLSAGNVHAYLRGVGIEIMANSDNVLRVGLTPKHVDVPELLRIADFTVLADPVLRARPAAAGGVTYDVPVSDFSLTAVEVDGSVEVGVAGPRIVLCTAGAASVDSVELTRGASAFVPASSGPLRITGTGTVFVAAPNL